MRQILIMTLLGTAILSATTPLLADDCSGSSQNINCVAATQNIGNITMSVGQSAPLDLSKLGTINRIFPGNRTVIDVFQDGKSGDIYLRGKKVGSSDILIWAGSKKYRMFVSVGIDTATLGAQLRQIMPGEADIHVTSMADSLVLSGTVSDAMKLKQVVALAEAYIRGSSQELQTESKVFQAPENEPGQSVQVRSQSGSNSSQPASLTQSGMGANRIINLITVRGSQQVMLEVKVAEISKNLLNRLGSEFGWTGNSGDWTTGIISGLLSGSGQSNNTVITAIKGAGKEIALDAQKKDELVKILAEPNIVAISGQEGSFLSGGKVFIPTGRDRDGTVTLEEKEYGVGLRFTPTVLSENIIDLRVSPEVSELNKDGSAFTSGGITTVFPSISTRRASTTVQLRDGESFAIAGLIKNNVFETVKKFPLLGDIPLIGMFFRSNEFLSEKTELLFVVTPRLIKPATPPIQLPTDNFREPSQINFMINGRMEAWGDEKNENNRKNKTLQNMDTKDQGDSSSINP